MNKTKKHTVLVIDDDIKLVSYICDYLELYEFETSRAHDGITGIEKILTTNPAVTVLDLMLPGTDGIDTCRQVRPQYTGHVLMLTGVDDDIDQVAAIEVGVDDYVVKPVQLRVLLARIRMLLRRGNSVKNSLLSDSLPKPVVDSQISGERSYGSLRIRKNDREAYLADRALNLNDSEFDLLWLFANHPEEILSRDMLLKSLRGIEYDGTDRSIDARLVRLRKKTGDNASKPFRIITVRSKGYMFVPDAWGTSY